MNAGSRKQLGESGRVACLSPFIPPPPHSNLSPHLSTSFSLIRVCYTIFFLYFSSPPPIFFHILISVPHSSLVSPFTLIILPPSPASLPHYSSSFICFVHPPIPVSHLSPLHHPCFSFQFLISFSCSSSLTLVPHSSPFSPSSKVSKCMPHFPHPCFSIQFLIPFLLVCPFSRPSSSSLVPTVLSILSFQFLILFLLSLANPYFVPSL